MSDARILDRAWQPYHGTRYGPDHAVRSVLVHTLRRILGLRRPARSKVLPVITIVMSYLPAAVFVGIVAFLGDRVTDVLPRYSRYYGFIISAIALFVTFVAPEALCPDRRSRVLSLYLASPLSRMSYLAAKLGAVATVIAFVTIGPPLLLLIGFALQGTGPDGVGGFFGVLGRIAASGVVVAAVYTAMSLAVSSLTDRRAFAAVGILLLFFGGGIAAGVLHFGMGGPVEWLLLDLRFVPLELVTRIHGEPGFFPEVETVALAAVASAWIAAGLGVTAVRYRNLQVTR